MLMKINKKAKICTLNLGYLCFNPYKNIISCPVHGQDCIGGLNHNIKIEIKRHQQEYNRPMIIDNSTVSGIKFGHEAKIYLKSQITNYYDVHLIKNNKRV